MAVCGPVQFFSRLFENSHGNGLVFSVPLPVCTWCAFVRGFRVRPFAGWRSVPVLSCTGPVFPCLTLENALDPSTYLTRFSALESDTNVRTIDPIR